MNPPSLELHYYLRNNSHAMNAFIRNKCEAEALAAFSYIAERLGIELAIESVAHEEGGLKDIWNFVCKPEVAWPAAATAYYTEQKVLRIPSSQCDYLLFARFLSFHERAHAVGA